MTKKMNLRQFLLAGIALFLAACGKETIALPTETVVPTVVSLTSAPTPTLIPITPSPLPTVPAVPFITPDAIQVERWNEYEDALAKALFPPENIPRSPTDFLCEWEILGRSNHEIYVWAVCTSTFPVGRNTGLPYLGEMPSVIQIDADGSVLSVEIPGGGNHYASDIRKMFPSDVQDKIFNHLIQYRRLYDHLEQRRTNPTEPPFIVDSATSLP